MTNKEKIVEIINKYLWKFDVDKLADELFEEFEKDLVVLEILKTMIRQNEITLTPKPIWNISNEDIEKLKEWLENGINNK